MTIQPRHLVDNHATSGVTQSEARHSASAPGNDLINSLYLYLVRFGIQVKGKIKPNKTRQFFPIFSLFYFANHPMLMLGLFSAMTNQMRESIAIHQSRCTGRVPFIWCPIIRGERV